MLDEADVFFLVTLTKYANCFLYPRFSLNTTIVIAKKPMIHVSVEMKPKYTSCSMMPQPRVSIHRKAVVACVNGKQYDMYLWAGIKTENLMNIDKQTGR